MKIRKSKLSVAVGTLLCGAVLAPATAFAVSYHIGRGSYGETYTESGGDALLFPIYTTVNGASTSFSVTNDDNISVNVIKIRFREQEHSMDVLDFIAVLSPNDKFDFWVSQGPDDERPVMHWNDNTCVVGPDGNSVMFPAPNTPFVTTNEQMQVGHLEVLGTRDIEDTCYNPSTGEFDVGSSGCSKPGFVNIGDWAIHDETGKPANCAGLVDLLSDPEKTHDIDDNSYDAGSALMGRYVITAGADGVEAGGDAVEVKSTDLRLYAQSKADCEEQYGCTSYYAWDKALWDHPHLGELDENPSDLNNLQTLVGADNVAGDWSNNPANAVGVDWVLTFFSKYVYLDYIAKSECNDEGSAKAWCLLAFAPNTSEDDPIGWNRVWTEESTTDTCLNDNELDVFGTEEDKATGNVNVSPGTRETLDLCNEVNVFTFAADEGAAPRDSLIQTNERRMVLGFKNLDAVRGWAEMDLNWNDDDDYEWGTVGGLIFTTRATDDPNHNNGSITEIKKTDAWDGD